MRVKRAVLDTSVETNGINMHMDRTWELPAPFARKRIEQPALFITGDRDL